MKLRLMVLASNSNGSKDVQDIFEQDTTKEKLLRRAKRELAKNWREALAQHNGEEPPLEAPTVTFQMFQIGTDDPFFLFQNNWKVQPKYNG